MELSSIIIGDFAMKNGMVWISIVLFLGLTFTATAHSPQLGVLFDSAIMGNTLYVGGTGPGNYSRIQDAIDNASVGDTIFVYSKSSPYYENIIIKKDNIKLIGQNKYNTTVDGNGVNHVIEVYADGVTVKEFTIQHSGQNEYPDYDAGILLYHFSRYNIITDNIIIDNKHGICLQFGSNNTLSTNIISHNYEGISFIGNSVYNIITQNKIENNNYGIHIAFTVYNKIIGNNIANNSEFGINFYFVRFHTVQKNNFINNTCDVYYIERLRLAFDRNQWLRNYWDTKTGFGPQIIKGQMYTEFVGQKLIPWINFDWLPAHKPYTIP
jgi:parallel beta-helix repeat protein